MQTQRIELYRPSEDEEYMCFRQREYFRARLLAWRGELVAQAALFLEELKEYRLRTADTLDQSTQQSEIIFDFSARERQNNLIGDIDQALARIAAGEYGYCEITGEEIGLRRLLARPVATRCIEAQEQFERMVNMRMKLAVV